MPAGRPPKIVHDRLKEGMRKDELKAIEDSTPVYQSQNFIPPETLTAKELKVWNWLVSIFRETVNCMVSDADVQLMELYCRAKVAADEADAALKKDSRPYILYSTGMYDRDGNEKMQLKANPNIKIRHDNMLLCLKYFDQLGLSPLARAKAGVKSGRAKQEENYWKSIMERNDD